jgi:hypothetical protein
VGWDSIRWQKVKVGFGSVSRDIHCFDPFEEAEQKNSIVPPGPRHRTDDQAQYCLAIRTELESLSRGNIG